MSDVCRKVAALCTRRAVIYQSLGGKYLYGPLGVGMRRHFKDLWWHSCVTSQDNVFGVDIPGCDSLCDVNENKDLLNAFHALGSLLKCNPPMGVATSRVADNGLRFTDPDMAIFGDLQNEELSVYQAVESNQVFKWMDHWQRARIKWWRELACGPSQFVLTQQSHNNNNNNNNNNDHNNNKGYLVEYSFPWGAEAVDSISNHGKIKNDALGEASLIEVKTSINRGLLAYVFDAYQEKAGEKSALAIDAKLAPYKLALVSSSRMDQRMVDEVVDYVTGELREAGVQVLNLAAVTEEEAERVYDEMGVPYSLILTEEMRETGILQLRSRDTTLKEDVHITLVKETVVKYTTAATVKS